MRYNIKLSKNTVNKNMQYLEYERSILQPRKGYGVNGKRVQANPNFTSIIKASSFQQFFWSKTSTKREIK